MAASLVTREGFPSALKLNPAQPGPRCFGSFMMRPSRTTEGNPIEIASNFQPPVVSFIFPTKSRGVIAGPDSNSRLSRSDISNFTWVPPISTTRTFRFMISTPFLAIALSTDADRSREPLEDALAFRRCRGTRRPAFPDLEGEKAKESKARKLQIETKILGNLLDGSHAVELRGELCFRHGEAEGLHARKTIARVSRNRSEIIITARPEFRLLNETQSSERPIIDVRIGSNAVRITWKFASLENKTHT